MELNTNPAKVVALFPESVAGRLSRPRSEWISLFGGPASKVKNDSNNSAHSAQEEKDDHDEASGEPAAADPAKPVLHSAGGLMNRFKNPLDAIRPSAKDPETASIASTTRRAPPPAGRSRRIDRLPSDSQKSR